MCPITYMDIIDAASAKSLRSRDSSYKGISLPESLELVYSKSTDSLPMTSFRVESEPCVQPEQISFTPGTQTLPNEVMEF